MFGCLCFASTLPRRDKFEARAKRVVLLGFSIIQKGYKLYDLDNRIMFISRDVVFREEVFPSKVMSPDEGPYPLLLPFIENADNGTQTQDPSVIGSLSKQPNMHPSESSTSHSPSNDSLAPVGDSSSDPDEVLVPVETEPILANAVETVLGVLSHSSIRVATG